MKTLTDSCDAILRDLQLIVLWSLVNDYVLMDFCVETLTDELAMILFVVFKNNLMVVW